MVKNIRRVEIRSFFKVDPFCEELCQDNLQNNRKILGSHPTNQCFDKNVFKKASPVIFIQICVIDL